MGDREGRPYAGLVAEVSSPMPVSRWPRSGRDGTPPGRGTPPRAKDNEAVPDSGWATARPAGAIGSRDGRPRGSPLRGPRRRGVVAHAGFPMAPFGSGWDAARAWDAASREGQRSRAGFGMGDGAPCGRDRVAGWATARVAPTRASSPRCRRPCRFPDGPVRVGMGRRQGVGRRLARRITKPCRIRDGRRRALRAR